MEIVLVVAVAENGVIGADGAIPWRLKSDMQRFKALTLGKPVVMGRKTFVSIGTPAAGPHQHRGDARSRFSRRRRGGDDFVRSRPRGCAGRRAAAFRH